MHVHKTAGEAITRALSPALAWNDVELGVTTLGIVRNQYFARTHGLAKHSGAQRIRDHFGDAIWQEYFSFAFVRHPFDRARSMYSFLEKVAARRSSARPRNLRYRLPGFRRSDPWNWPAMIAYRQSADFSEFLRHPELSKDPVSHSQFKALSDGDGRLLVDYVGRMERLTDDFAYVTRRVGLEGLKLTPANVSGSGSFRGKSLSADDREFLWNLHRPDFERFGYSPDAEAALAGER